MRRRTLLGSTAAAGVVAATGGTVAGALVAAEPAAAAEYLVATTEQKTNDVLVFSHSNTSWSDGNVRWRWSAPAGSTWTNLSDVKRRPTAAWGDVVLVAASGTASAGGKAAMIDQSSKSVVWSATVPGNPHAVERIKNYGAIVVASSRARQYSSSFADGGGLSLFIPSSNGGKPGTSYSGSVKYGFEGAHGVLYDTNSGLLLAVGKGELRAYHLVVNSSGHLTGLKLACKTTFSGTGHDLQPDYASGKFFYTVGGTGTNHGVWEVSLLYAGASWVFSGKRRISTATYVKAYGSLPNGVRFYVDAPSESQYWTSSVGFSSGGSGSRSGAKFYKARYWTTAFV
ncbi:MAG: hypothetical protein HOU81_13740 [Hamadaea sp.]|uniref:hypothetical protein n=1 Tax=Hamadaea sp. TaxID=2024425 RepID=UPI0017B0E6A9|nr:hypothetical protein [Hamadaea sp.]NUR71880.1 hypothetical protein [Hamadaea sp.]NUT19900.1 hypothetical protein [Hamadaea sp.]